MTPLIRTALFALLGLFLAACSSFGEAPDAALDAQSEFSAGDVVMTRGHSYDLDAKTPVPYHVVLPPGKDYSDVVGFAINQHNVAVAWFREGNTTLSRYCGRSYDLTTNECSTETFSIPAGYTVSQIRGMAIAGNGVTFTFFDSDNSLDGNGTVAKGSSTDLDYYNIYSYSAGAFLLADDVARVAMDKDSKVYSWSDLEGLAQRGRTNDLGYHNDNYPFSSAQIAGSDLCLEPIDAAISKSQNRDNFVYTMHRVRSCIPNIPPVG